MKKKAFAIIGDPIAHSLSPVLHNYWFNKYNIEADYSLLNISEKDLGSVANSSGVVSTFSNFKVTTDGTNTTGTSEDFFVVVGNSSYTGVFVWKDNGNGVMSTDELSHMANLTGVNNDSISGVEFAFQSISGV